MARILVVDVNATAADATRKQLESGGFEVELTSSTEAGLDRLRAGGIDLVLAEIALGVVSGYELCRRAKSTPETRDVPVVLVTVLADPLDVIRALECGADGFITKGWSADHLIHRVQVVLENRRVRKMQPREAPLAARFLDTTFHITAERPQILDLLVSMFEDTVRKHRAWVTSQDQLRAVNRELTAFSSAVSHDLGAPLRAIDGWLTQLELDNGQQLDEDGRGHIARARAAAGRMRQIIDDLLRLSQVANAELKRRDFDFSALAMLVGSSLISFHPEHVVEFVVAPGLRSGGDRSLVQVVLENLLGNAWKFTSKQPHSRIEVGETTVDGAAAFFVRDNGVGFDMKYAARLFMPFERLHADAQFKGNGIGLMTARRIVERHGGRIWADSEVGKGATFYFTLS